jgi:hypothetical protein
MFPKLELTYARSDTTKIVVKANNANFAGETELYAHPSKFALLAEELNGFPNSIEHEVVFEVSNKESGYGHCCLKFYCFDKIGHTALHVSLSTEASNHGNKKGYSCADFKIHFEASELDVFVSSLQKALDAGHGTSKLMGINEYTQNIQ